MKKLLSSPTAPAKNPHQGFLSIIAACLFVLSLSFIDPRIMEVLAVNAKDFKGAFPTVHGLLSLFTYQFGHAGWFHFFGNFFFFAPFALYLEPRIGTRSFVALFLASGVGSALLFMGVPQLFGWGGLIGASGSICGVVAAALLRFGRSPVMRGLAIATLIGFFFPELCMAVMSSVMPDGIAHWGHIGGAITGMIFVGVGTDAL